MPKSTHEIKEIINMRIKKNVFNTEYKKDI